VQPFGAALEAPFEKTGALVELPYQDHELIRARVDARGEIDDGTIECIDREMTCGVGGCESRVHGGFQT
jgi:hypothetical protein